MTTSDSSLQDGSGTSPNVPSSSSVNVQRGSEAGTYTKAEFDALKARLDKFERDTQSNKDRAVKSTNQRLDKFENELKPLLEQAQKYISNGSSVNEAVAQVQVDQDKAERENALYEMAMAFKSGKLPSTLAGNESTEGVDVTEVITDLGLDPSDPAVKVAFEGKKFTLEQAELTAARLVREKKKLPTPTQAQAPSSVGSAIKTADIAALTAEHSELIKNPTKNFKRIQEIQEAIG